MEKITSRNNEKIKYACSLKKAGARKSEGKLLAEGLRLCLDAAENGVEIDFCFISKKELENERVKPILNVAKASFIIEEHIALKLADTKNPQGIFCVCTPTPTEKIIDTNGKYILLENIADPGNLGTAIRTAEAFGLSGAVLKGCCDVFSPKALRASMGASFRFPVIEDDDMSVLRESLSKGMNLYCSVVDSDAEDVKALRGKSGIFCAIGNEANGLSDEIKALGERITIHMRGRAESFNASQAATVVMYEMTL